MRYRDFYEDMTTEGYPWGGFTYTDADKEVDDKDVERTQNNPIGKIKVGTTEVRGIRPDKPGFEDSDINNDGKSDITDKYLKAKRDLTKSYKAAKKSNLDMQQPTRITEEFDESGISEQDARRIYDKLNYNFDFDEFLTGMNVELEHKDVTGGDLIKTAKIAAAHLKEVPNYYTLLKKYVEKQND